MSEDPNCEFVGAIKIKDGLFIGDEFAAQDLEFVASNKVTHIINCASRQVQNHWEPIGVAYLSFPWADSDEQIILNAHDTVTNQCFTFIEEAMGKAESTLIHSMRGQSRACSITASYLMRKYRWTLQKTLEFLQYRRPDIEIRTAFIHQLGAFEARLIRFGVGAKTSTWLDVYNGTNQFENEELLLRNTYINAHLSQFQGGGNPAPQRRATRKLRWTDQPAISTARIAIQQNPLAVVIFEDQSRRSTSRTEKAPTILRKEGHTRPPPVTRERSAPPRRETAPNKIHQEDHPEDIIDFLHELREISDGKYSKPKAKEISNTLTTTNLNKAESILHSSVAYKENILKERDPCLHYENSVFGSKIKKIEPKLHNRSQPRASSASSQRESQPSPKSSLKSKNLANISPFRREEKRHVKRNTCTNPPSRVNCEHPPEEHNRNSSVLSFGSFKNPPTKIGSDLYSKKVPKPSAECKTIQSIRFVSNPRNCLSTTSGSAVKALPSSSAVPAPSVQSTAKYPTDGVAQKVPKAKNAKMRPASPGVRGKKVESPYKSYVDSIRKSMASLTQTQSSSRSRSAKYDRRAVSREHTSS